MVGAVLPCCRAPAEGLSQVGAESKHFGSMAPVAMAEVARALDAGDSRLVPKRLICIVRALTPGEELKTLHSRSAALVGDTRHPGIIPRAVGCHPPESNHCHAMRMRALPRVG